MVAYRKENLEGDCIQSWKLLPHFRQLQLNQQLAIQGISHRERVGLFTRSANISCVFGSESSLGITCVSQLHVPIQPSTTCLFSVCTASPCSVNIFCINKGWLDGKILTKYPTTETVSWCVFMFNGSSLAQHQANAQHVISPLLLLVQMAY
jgi:hypothetical protein